MKYILFFFISILGIEIYLYLQFAAFSYPLFIKTVLEKFHTSFLIEQFPLYFTERRFDTLRIILPILLALQGIVGTFIIVKKNIISAYLNALLLEISYTAKKYLSLLKTLTLFQLFFLGSTTLLIIVSRIYLLNRYPFNGDEALSFFTFINNGCLLTSCFYPEPNNHILYNLVAILFNQFIDNPLYVMRLPNVIINMILLGIIFIYLFKKQNFTTAIIFLIAAGFSFSTSIFAVHGRGYMMVSLFAVLALISTIELVHNPTSKLAFFSLIVSCILGMYTIPIFTFIIVGLSLFLIYHAINHKNIRLFILKFFIYTTFGWLILYTPTFLVSGFDAVFNNGLIYQHTNLEHYFFYIVPVASEEATNFIVGTFSKGYLVLLFVGSVMMLTYKKTNDAFIKKAIVLILCCMLGCLAVMITKRVFGEFRVFAMYGFLFCMVNAICFAYWINKLKNTFVINSTISLIALFYMLLIPISFDKKMYTFYGTNYFLTYQRLDKDINNITATNPKTIFVSSKGHLLYLRLHKLINKKTYTILTPNSTIQLPLDYIIVENKAQIPKKIKLNDYLNTTLDTTVLLLKHK